MAEPRRTRPNGGDEPYIWSQAGDPYPSPADGDSPYPPAASAEEALHAANGPFRRGEGLRPESYAPLARPAQQWPGRIWPENQVAQSLEGFGAGPQSFFSHPGQPPPPPTCEQNHPGWSESIPASPSGLPMVGGVYSALSSFDLFPQPRLDGFPNQMYRDGVDGRVVGAVLQDMQRLPIQSNGMMNHTPLRSTEQFQFNPNSFPFNPTSSNELSMPNGTLEMERNPLFMGVQAGVQAASGIQSQPNQRQNFPVPFGNHINGAPFQGDRTHRRSNSMEAFLIHNSQAPSLQTNTDDPPPRPANTWRQRCTYLDPTKIGGKEDDYELPEVKKCVDGYMLDFIVTTWTRDSHDLFDYEAHNDRIGRELMTFKINENNLEVPHFLLRIKYKKDADKVKIHLQDMKLRNITAIMGALNDKEIQNIDVLMQITVRQEEELGYVVEIEEPDEELLKAINIDVLQKKDFYEVVRDIEYENTKSITRLQNGMCIKLGRYPVRVKQLVATGDDPVVPEMTELVADKTAIERTTILSLDESKNYQCRICLGDGAEEGDPLVNACVCRGSIQWMHATCLKYWFQNNEAEAGDEETHSTSCRIKATFCELCKTQFPPFIFLYDEELGAEKQFNFRTINKLMPPFVVLESMQDGPNMVYANTLLPTDITLPGEEGDKKDRMLKVGRGHESHMRIPDVSISRIHTEITMDGEDFILYDRRSKFGTLLQVPKKILSAGPSMADRRTSLQCGRSVVDFVVRNFTEAEMEAIRH